MALEARERLLHNIILTSSLQLSMRERDSDLKRSMEIEIERDSEKCILLPGEKDQMRRGVDKGRHKEKRAKEELFLYGINVGTTEKAFQ